MRNRNITETQLFRWPGQSKQTCLLKEHLTWRNRWVVLYSALRTLYLNAHCERLKLQIDICEFWGWRKMDFYMPSTLEVIPGLSLASFSPLGSAGEHLCPLLLLRSWRKRWKVGMKGWSMCGDYWAWDEGNVKNYVALDIWSNCLVSY